MPKSTRRGILYTSAIAIPITVLLTWTAFRSYALPTPVAIEAPAVTVAAVSATESQPTEPSAAKPETPAEFAARDPYAFIKHAQERYHDYVKAYRVMITKQENLSGHMTAVQETELRYRSQPEHIYMLWTKNADSAKRALYKADDPRCHDEDGNKYARVEPSGLARLIVSDIMIPIHGSFAEGASRHTMDNAHFGAFFRMVFKYTDMAVKNNEVQLVYAGTGEVAGRPTIVIERHLPYEGPKSIYPDRRLVMHFDAEHLLPAAVYQWADMDEKEMLGRYIYTDLQINPGFTEEDFTF